MEVFFRFLWIGGILAASAVFAAEPEPQIEWGSLKEVNATNAQSDFGRYVMAPFVVSFDLVFNTISQGVVEGVQTTVAEDIPYVGGYVGAVYLSYRLKKMFFEIGLSDFIKKTDKVFSSEPKRVLFLNFISEKDPLAGYPEGVFATVYSNHPDAQLLHISSFADLREKLQALPQDQSIDRIEIFGHGAPGKIGIGIDPAMNRQAREGTLLSQEKLSLLGNLNLDFAAPGAELRLVSCSLATNTFRSTVGEDFLKSIATIFLPRGGRALATPKVIIAKTIPIVVPVQHLMGIKIMVDIVKMLPSINRNFRQARNDLIEVERRAVSTVNKGTCSGQYATSVRWLR